MGNDSQMTPKKVALKWGERMLRFCIANNEPFKRCFYAFQRGLYGYSDEDVFSIDYWLDEVMPPAIDELISKKISCPGEFLEDKDGITEEEIVAGIEKWKKVMRQIRDGFVARRGLSNNYYCLSPQEKKIKIRKFRRGMLLMARYYHTMWW